jgi:hypothetical protein
MLKPLGVGVVGAMIWVAVTLATVVEGTGAFILYRPYTLELEQRIHRLPDPSNAISPEFKELKLVEISTDEGFLNTLVMADHALVSALK